MIFMYAYILFISVLYLSLFGYLGFKWKHYSPQEVNPAKRKSFISIIVAHHNEGENLNELCRLLFGQNQQKDMFELILIDDYSDIPYEFDPIIRENKAVRILRNTYPKGKKYALKTGVEAAKSRIILTTDADCLPGKNWVKSVAEMIPDHDDFFMSLPVFMEKGKGFFQAFQALEFSSLVASGAASFAAGFPIMCNGANLCYSKKLFLEAFDNIYPDIPSGDDMFLMLYASGKKSCQMMFGKSGNTVTITKGQDSLKSFFRQRQRWSSKSVFYRDGFLIFVSFLLLIYNLSILTIGVMAIFIPSLLTGLSVLFGIKLLSDFIFLRIFLKFFGRTEYLKFFIPSQFLYPFYIVLTAFAGIFKGISYRK